MPPEAARWACSTHLCLQRATTKSVEFEVVEQSKQISRTSLVESAQLIPKFNPRLAEVYSLTASPGETRRASSLIPFIGTTRHQPGPEFVAINARPVCDRRKYTHTAAQCVGDGSWHEGARLTSAGCPSCLLAKSAAARPAEVAAEAGVEAGPKLLTLAREGAVDSGVDGAAERLAEVAASDTAGADPNGSRGQPGDAATV